MTYREAREKAETIRTEEELKNYLKMIESNENITDLQYYNLRHWAIEALYE